MRPSLSFLLFSLQSFGESFPWGRELFWLPCLWNDRSELQAFPPTRSSRRLLLTVLSSWNHGILTGKAHMFCPNFRCQRGDKFDTSHTSMGSPGLLDPY